MIGVYPDWVVITMDVCKFNENTKEMNPATFFPDQSVVTIKANCARDLGVLPW